ncbi:hypothetical protein KI387_021815 [Taxus chinensis]|uniref:TraB domain-containing protein n=1 Tax=Taxus chinensis TaxID=29808 RepID=A0AA38LDW9_TAXCH|nr:hypothetical protein KI387_021815 [Taxus chinensis]
MNLVPRGLSMMEEPKEMKKSLNVVAERVVQWGRSQKNKELAHRKPLMKNAPKKVHNFGLYRNGPNNSEALFPPKTSGMQAPDVEAVVAFLKPDAVFLELCASRSNLMLPQEPQLLELPGFTEIMVHLWRNKNTNAFHTLGTLILQKCGKEFGVIPGCEFQSAYREAEKYGGKIILGDRPIEITCQRTWSKMSLWYKTKFVFMSLLMLSTKSLTPSVMDADNNRVLEKQFPIIAETLNHERDLYMASTLLKVASDNKSVVAVVGSAHVAGIQKNWKKPIEIESLMEFQAIKSPSSLQFWTSILLSAGATSAIISALMLKLRG